MDPVSHSAERRAAFFFPTLAAILWVDTSGLEGVCVPLCWIVYCLGEEGGRASASDLEMLCATSKDFFNPLGQSNPPMLIPRRFTRSSGDSVKSRGQITSLLANPPETCAKKHLAHLECQLTLKCRNTRVWMGLIHWSCVFVGNTGGVFKYALPCPHPKTHTHAGMVGGLPGLWGTDFPRRPADERWSSERRLLWPSAWVSPRTVQVQKKRAWERQRDPSSGGK